MVSRNNYIEENPGTSDTTLLQNWFYFLSAIVAYGWPVAILAAKANPPPLLYPMGRARVLKHVSEPKGWGAENFSLA
jgi:hypothetical protein